MKLIVQCSAQDGDISLLKDTFRFRTGENPPLLKSCVQPLRTDQDNSRECRNGVDNQRRKSGHAPHQASPHGDARFNRTLRRRIQPAYLLT